MCKQRASHLCSLLKVSIFRDFSLKFKIACKWVIIPVTWQGPISNSISVISDPIILSAIDPTKTEKRFWFFSCKLTDSADYYLPSFCPAI